MPAHEVRTAAAIAAMDAAMTRLRSALRMVETEVTKPPRDERR